MPRQLPRRRVYSDAFPTRKDVILWEVLEIQHNDILCLSFEEKRSPWEQGVALMSDLGLEIDGVRNSGFVLWYGQKDQFDIRCFTSNGLLHLYNVWDKGHGLESQSYTSGMIIEGLEKGFRYHCNDIGFDTNFDKLVFRID